MSHNGATEKPKALRFTVIPMDFCPRCPIPTHPDDVHYGMPVAQAGPLENRVVRYVCRACRLLWDMWYDLSGPGVVRPSGGTFSDTFIRDAEGLEARPLGDIDMPVGPRSALTHGARSDKR